MMPLVKFNKHFYFLFLFLIVACLFSGCVAFNLRIADNYYEEFAYSRAIPKYEAVLRKTFNPIAASNLADAYRKTGNSLKAEIWYRRLAVSHDIVLLDKLNFAEVLMENGKYNEAKSWFTDYLKLNNADKRVKRLLQACDSIHLFFEDTTVYEIQSTKINVGNESNFSPTFYKDGIVFLSDRSAPGKNRVTSVWTGKEYLDLFFTHPTGLESWSEPELLKGDINGLYDEGPAAFSPNQLEIYFTRTDYTGKTVEKNLKNVSTLKLYHGKLNGNQWMMQSLLPFNSKDYSVGHPALSPDGNTLYFVSDMPWGYGGTDIYKVVFRNGQWTSPQNLGAAINTEGNEMFPFFASDSTLYFASDGFVGLGGLDLYSVEWDGESYTKPENLQFPINSSKDDFGLIINAASNKGFFTTNRKRNLDMIYSFTKNPPVFGYELFVIDSKTKKPVRNFNVYTISKKNETKDVGTSTTGKLNINLNRNTDYHAVVKSSGYYAFETQFTTVGKRKSELISGNVELSKIELNKSVVWKKIIFSKKETVISEKTALVLDSLAHILTLNPEMEIEIASHTDSRGSFIDNLNISKTRAEVITNYLVGKGIKISRLSPIGYGEGKLLNNCRDGILCLEEDHQVNNRIEIKVIGLISN
jgi:peptidoglycan-associated lipoprotein